MSVAFIGKQSESWRGSWKHRGVDAAKLVGGITLICRDFMNVSGIDVFVHVKHPCAALLQAHAGFHIYDRIDAFHPVNGFDAEILNSPRSDKK